MTMVERWCQFLERVQARTPFLDEFKELEWRYAEPWRAYHDLGHIEHCLTEFEEVRDYARKPGETEMAIWLHDASYDPRACDKEEKSAKIALRMVEQLGLSYDFGSEVVRLILLTKHKEEPKTVDEELLLDIDLAILGRSKEEFDIYEENIRQEYAHVPLETFQSKRKEILSCFLNSRPFIYRHSHFRYKYEQGAKENLRRSIEKLSG